MTHFRSFGRLWGDCSISQGPDFQKNLTTNLWKTYEKVRLTKTLGWACDFQKILWKT